jgi:hypothetical protein
MVVAEEVASTVEAGVVFTAEASVVVAFTEVGTAAIAVATVDIVAGMVDSAVQAGVLAEGPSGVAPSAARADIPVWGAAFPVEGDGWAMEPQLTPVLLTAAGMDLEAEPVAPHL